MRVPHGEGLATHIGPESCVHSRKGMGEALAGGVWVRLLSREIRIDFGVPTLSSKAEGNTGRIVIARCDSVLRGQRPCARTQAPCAGTGRSHFRSCTDGGKARAENPNGARQR